MSALGSCPFRFLKSVFRWDLTVRLDWLASEAQGFACLLHPGATIPGFFFWAFLGVLRRCHHSPFIRKTVPSPCCPSVAAHSQLGPSVVVPSLCHQGVYPTLMSTSGLWRGLSTSGPWGIVLCPYPTTPWECSPLPLPASVSFHASHLNSLVF